MISIIIPTYNRAELLSKCINSLIKQDYPKNKYEIIVVDDGSSDNTKELAENFIKKYKNIQYINHPKNRGVAASRNTGIKKAKGENVAIVADDYILPENYLSTINKQFKNTDIKIMSFEISINGNDFLSNVFQSYYDAGKYPLIHGEESSRGFFIDICQEKTIKKTLLPASGAAVFRKELFKKIGLFDEDLRTGEDTDFSYRLHKNDIYVYYNPFVKIRHFYSNTMFKIMRRMFFYGISYYRIKKKHPSSSLVLPDTFNNVLRDVIEIFYRPFIRCRYANSFKKLALYYPFMLFFDLSRVIGIFYGYIKK